MKLASVVLLIVLCVVPRLRAADPPAPYDALIRQGNKLMADDKPKEAYATALEAVTLDAKRFEGYALAAMVMQRQGAAAQASKFLAKAIELAPAEKQPTLEKLRALLERSAAAATSVPAAASAAPALSPEGQRKLDALMQISADAYKASSPQDRLKSLREFIAKSNDFVIEHPEQLKVWAMRAVAAIELDYPGIGWIAGRQLKALGAMESQDPNISKIVTQLERKEWLGKTPGRRDWYWWTPAQMQKAAEDGDIEAQNVVAERYELGRAGLTRNEPEAAKWYRKAADQGDAFAQHKIGTKYSQGRGVAKDDAEAAKWYRKAAEQGYADAQLDIGLMYVHGRGVTGNDLEAAKWFRKAAEQGVADAQTNIGHMYFLGRGIAKNETEAAKWYRKGAEQGIARAQGNLGFLYSQGRGVPKDDAEAVKWYRKAADQGHADAQNGIGEMYSNGRGVAKDEAEAVKWLRKAAEQGNNDAKENLRKIQERGVGK